LRLLWCFLRFWDPRHFWIPRSQLLISLYWRFVKRSLQAVSRMMLMSRWVISVRRRMGGSLWWLRADICLEVIMKDDEVIKLVRTGRFLWFCRRNVYTITSLQFWLVIKRGSS
jgi:hypothetical protein